MGNTEGADISRQRRRYFADELRSRRAATVPLSLPNQWRRTACCDTLAVVSEVTQLTQ